MNNFSCTANLGRDSEFRQLPNGGAVLNFPIAVTSGFGDNQKTTWIRCAVFGKRAEGKLSTYLVKGQQVAVTGEITLREWDDKDGNKRSSLELNVNGLDLIGGQQQGQQPRQQPQQTQQQEQTSNAGGYVEDDIPFAQYMRNSII